MRLFRPSTAADADADADAPARRPLQAALEAGLTLDPTGADRDGSQRVRLLAVLCGGGYLFAAMCALAGPIFSPASIHPVAADVIAGLVSIATGVLLLAWSSMPARLVRFLSLQCNILQITVLLAIVTPAYPLLVFYVWGGFTVGYFGTRNDAIATALLIYVGGAIGIALSTLPLPAVGYMSTIGVAIPPIFVLRALRLRRDAMILKLDAAASTDALTGLANRRSFMRTLDREFDRVQRDGTSLAVALFDLDHFKAINDHHGHPAGDRALKRFATLLQTGTAQSDLCSRVGGEEFTLVLPGCDLDAARVVAQRLIDLVAAETADDLTPITTSCGVAVITPAIRTADDLLIAADRALYAAKEGGRHRVAVAEELYAVEMSDFWTAA